MSRVELGEILERDSGLTVREIGEETVIVSERGDNLHTLNGVGQFVWRALDGERSLLAVLDLVCDEYSVARPAAQADLLEFAGQLVERGLVRARTV